VNIAGVFTVFPSEVPCSNPRLSKDAKRGWDGYKNDCAMDELERWEVIPEREKVLAIKVLKGKEMEEKCQG
jgi:hypothetical protein